MLEPRPVASSELEELVGGEADLIAFCWGYAAGSELPVCRAGNRLRERSSGALTVGADSWVLFWNRSRLVKLEDVFGRIGINGASAECPASGFECGRDQGTGHECV